MIVAKNIKHKFGSRDILNGLDIEIKRGELTILMGVNGCGKSTALNVICADIQPDSGVVEIDGVDLNKISISQQARIRAVYRQAHQISFNYTAYEIIENGRYIYEKEMSKQDNAKVIEKVMRDMNVWKFRERDYSTLSGGEKSRVQFARVLAQAYNEDKEKSFILLDEPNSALDVKYSVDLMKKAKQLSRQGYGVFMILHDINLAFQYGDKIYLMDKGKISSVGTGKKRISNNILAKVYGVDVDLLSERGKKSFIFE